jgi:hypothetical protein
VKALRLDPHFRLGMPQVKSGPLVSAVIILAGCAHHGPPPAPAPRDATSVNAPADRTWDAVIDVFAGRNIPIRSIERGSRLVVTDELRVGSGAQQYADCGQAADGRLRPNYARYNALVRGDSAGSTVTVTVFYSYVTDKAVVKDCSTTYALETRLESEVKARAEARAIAAANPSPGTGPAPGTANGSGRSNNELLAHEGFRRAIGDLQRNGLLLAYREPERERLQVDLSAVAMGQPTLEYQLTRLFLAYGETMYDDSNPMLEIRANRQQIGVYTRDGLRWSVASDRQ